MIIARRLLVIASVVTYGSIAVVLSSPSANASHHRHHVDSVSRHAQTRESRREERPGRRRHHEADVARVSQPTTHRARLRLMREKRAEEVAASRPLTHRERMQLKREHRIEIAEAVYDRNHAYEEHLTRLYRSEHSRRQAHLEAVAQYARHLARIDEYRKERLAEMNGELSSKSIRAWQTYVVNTPVRIITCDLNDPGVKVNALLASDGIGSSEPFYRMIRRTQPDVAVTGTFFSLDNLHPVGDIVINGGLRYFGGMGTALCITPLNKADMVTVPWGHHHDWSGYDFVMACGPRLLQNHQIVLDPTTEHFRERSMLAKNSRIAVGITPGNKLVFVMTTKPIYLGRLAKIMRDVGCSQAMNLDAGTSTGFYCEGNMMARPGRWLTNAIVVYANQHNTTVSST